MPLDTLPPGTEVHNRWDGFRVRESNSDLSVYWLCWTLATIVSAMGSSFVIGVITTNKKLRSRVFNKFVVALAIPDFLFSFSCSFSCFINYLHGEWANGNLNCEIQSVYCVFGMAASIWVNVAVTHELYKMGWSGVNLKPYKGLSNWEFLSVIGGIYILALFFGVCTLIPGLPYKANAVRGLACLPTEYDRASTLFFWLGFTPAFLVFPLVAIFTYFVLICRMGLLDPWTVLGYSSESGKSSTTGALSVFFARLLSVFLIMWLPSLLFIWILGYENGFLPFIGGLWSHFQGLISALMYLHKDDILKETPEWFQKIDATITSAADCRYRLPSSPRKQSQVQPSLPSTSPAKREESKSPESV